MDNDAKAHTILKARRFLRAIFKEDTINPNPNIIVRKLEKCRNSSGNNLCRTRIRSGNLGIATDHKLITPLPNVMKATGHTRAVCMAL
jgi:hypothetical protein